MACERWPEAEAAAVRFQANHNPNLTEQIDASDRRLLADRRPSGRQGRFRTPRVAGLSSNRKRNPKQPQLR